MIGAIGLDFACWAYGREGDCLLDASEFKGCTVGKAETSADVCDKVQMRLTQDAARPWAPSLIYSNCDAMSQCRYAFEVDGRCFANNSDFDGLSYDCSLGGAAIVERYRQDVLRRNLDDDGGLQ